MVIMVLVVCADNSGLTLQNKTKNKDRYRFLPFDRTLLPISMCQMYVLGGEGCGVQD